jgi:tetratricopeptide (TPR) repeat protein
MFRRGCLIVALLLLAASLSRAQDDAPTKWVKGDQVMPKREKIELKCRETTLYGITDIKWPATVKQINGHWLQIGDDGTNRVDGKPIVGWVSKTDVLKFKAAKPDKILDQTAEQVVRQYTESLDRKDSLWLHWLRGICLEQLGQYDGAIAEYTIVVDSPPPTTTSADAGQESPHPPSPAPPCGEAGYQLAALPAPPFPDTFDKVRADAFAGRGRCRSERQLLQATQEDFALARGIYVGVPPHEAPPRYLRDKAQSLFVRRDSLGRRGFLTDDARSEATGLLDAALQAKKSFVDALTLKGNIFRLENDLIEAKKKYNAAIAAEPTNSLGYYKLSFLINQDPTSTPRERQLAINAAEKASTIATYTYPMLSQLRTAQYIQGNIWEATVRQAQVVRYSDQQLRLRELRVLRQFSFEANVSIPHDLDLEERLRRNDSLPPNPDPSLPPQTNPPVFLQPPPPHILTPAERVQRHGQMVAFLRRLAEAPSQTGPPIAVVTPGPAATLTQPLHFPPSPFELTRELQGERP